MGANDNCRYRWIQYGGAWTEATVLSTVSWIDADADLVPVNIPLQVEKHGGPSPSTLTLRIAAASTQAVAPGDGIYDADNVTTATSRRADGTSGTMYYPMIDAAYPLKEFELIRLMDAASNSAGDKASGTGVFVGVVTDMDLTSDPSGGDVWIVTVSEISAPMPNTRSSCARCRSSSA